jgi:hypothetical protein
MGILPESLDCKAEMAMLLAGKMPVPHWEGESFAKRTSLEW